MNLYHCKEATPCYTIGITGHRDASSDEASSVNLEQVVKQLIDDVDVLASKILKPEEQPPFKLKMISALAAGADQIGAQAMLTSALKNNTVRELNVVLPFEKLDYKSTLGKGLPDKVSDKAHIQFDSLINQAARIFELADWQLPDNSTHHPRTSHWRNQRYRSIGQMIVAQSDILIAIWRGGPAAGLGGTADVVQIAIAAGIPVLRIDPDTLVISLLKSTHQSEDAVALAQKKTKFDFSNSGNQAFLSLLISESLVGNKDNSTSPGSYRHFIEQENAKSYSYQCFYQLFAWLIQEPRKLLSFPNLTMRNDWLKDSWISKQRNKEDPRREVDETLKENALAADAIATASGHTYRSVYLMIFLGAVLAVWIGLLGIIWSTYKAQFVLGEVIVLFILIGLYRQGGKKDWHNQWLNARNISEGFRSTRFMAWIGFGGRRALRGRFDWTIFYVNSVMSEQSIPNTKITTKHLTAMAHELNHHFVSEQRDYHDNNQKKLSKFHHRLDIIGWGCLGLVIFIALLFLSFYSYLSYTDLHGLSSCEIKQALDNPKRIVAVVCAGFPLLAASLAGIRYQGDFERFAKRSGDTKNALEQIKHRLNAFERRAELYYGPHLETEPPLFEEYLHITQDLSDIFIADLQDWHYVYSARPNPGVG